MKYITYLLLLGITMICGYTDLKYHKIFNKYTFPFMICGMTYNLLTGGLQGLGNSTLGILVGISASLLWILGMLKAGDVKLYMAVGALGGWKLCSYSMIYSVLFGGIAATILLLVRKDGASALKRLKEYFVHLFYTKTFHSYIPTEKQAYFSFGGCILVGTVMAILYMEFY